MSTTEKVIVIWGSKDSIENGLVNVLDSYEGTRVYDRDMVDGRLTPDGNNLPYAGTIDAAVKHMVKNPGKPVQFPLTLAKKLGIY